jgi:hypothetical protein
MDKEEEILEGYVNGRLHGEDNKLQAAIGSLSARRMNALSEALLEFNRDIKFNLSNLILNNSHNAQDLNRGLGQLNNGISQGARELSRSMGESQDELARLNINLEASIHSSDKHSNAMRNLTVGLVCIALAQAVVAGLPYWQAHKESIKRHDCYQTVLQTSDIDLNYKNCLRNQGLSE